MEAPGISGGDILQLNVGGDSVVVTRGTLTQVTGRENPPKQSFIFVPAAVPLCCLYPCRPKALC